MRKMKIENVKFITEFAQKNGVVLVWRLPILELDHPQLYRKLNTTNKWFLVEINHI